MLLCFLYLFVELMITMYEYILFKPNDLAGYNESGESNDFLPRRVEFTKWKGGRERVIYVFLSITIGYHLRVWFGNRQKTIVDVLTRRTLSTHQAVSK